MTGAAPNRAFDRRFYGVVEAIVVDNVDPDKQGRIKVRFPWYDDGTITEWCRVRQLYAGPGYGTFFVPEVNDEVLVAFIHGDMRLAIVLGGLYNGVDRPPSDRQGDAVKNEKVIRTKGGHAVVLDDTTGKRSIQVTSSTGHQLRLDDAANQITVRTSAGQTIVMDANDGSITVTGATITLTGLTIALGGTSITLGGASERAVLGDQLMALFNGHVHPVGAGTTGTPVTPMSDVTLSQTVRVG